MASVTRETMMQDGQRGVENPSLVQCPRGSVGTLETSGCRLFRIMAKVAIIAGELATLLVGNSETSVSDIAIIAKSPQNTSGFCTYISQGTVISQLS
jgi:hypothetical protein